jgi:DEAD/DEAH box helicase/GRF zinc finger
MPEISNNRQYHRNWIERADSISEKRLGQICGFQYAIQPDGSSLGERLWNERRQRNPNSICFRHDLTQQEPPFVSWKEIELWSSTAVPQAATVTLSSSSFGPSTFNYSNPHTTVIRQQLPSSGDDHSKITLDDEPLTVNAKNIRSEVLEDCDDLFLDLDVDKLLAERRNQNGQRSSGISEISLLSSDMMTPKGSSLSNSFLAENSNRNDSVIVSGKSPMDLFQGSVQIAPSFYDLCDTSNDDSSIRSRYHSKSPFKASNLEHLNISSSSINSSSHASHVEKNLKQSSYNETPGSTHASQDPVSNYYQHQTLVQNETFSLPNMKASGDDYQGSPCVSSGCHNFTETPYNSVHHSSHYYSSGGNLDNQAPLCPMHNTPCRLLTARSEANAGRPFYKCALLDHTACDFFQWADGQETTWNQNSTNSSPWNDLNSPAGDILDYSTENRRKFGHSSFRPGQREVIENALQGRDVFVLMPTGGGKSLCYQLPAWCCPGLSVIISPLLSLIQDQVQSMTKLGVQSVFLNSAQDYETEQRDVQRRLFSTTSHGGIKLLYITPEKLRHSGVIRNVLNTLYERSHISRFVVDEAHCLR